MNKKSTSNTELLIKDLYIRIKDYQVFVNFYFNYVNAPLVSYELQKYIRGSKNKAPCFTKYNQCIIPKQKNKKKHDIPIKGIN